MKEGRQTSRELVEKKITASSNNSHSSSIHEICAQITSLASLLKTKMEISFKLLLNILVAIEQHAVINSAVCAVSRCETNFSLCLRLGRLVHWNLPGSKEMLHAKQPRERPYSTKLTPSARSSHAPSQQRQTPCHTSRQIRTP